MKTGSAWVLVGLVTMVVAGLAIVGCESTQTADNVITITPSNPTLTNDYETVTFTASASGTKRGPVARPASPSGTRPCAVSRAVASAPLQAARSIGAAAARRALGTARARPLVVLGLQATRSTYVVLAILISPAPSAPTR